MWKVIMENAVKENPLNYSLHHITWEEVISYSQPSYKCIAPMLKFLPASDDYRQANPNFFLMKYWTPTICAFTTKHEETWHIWLYKTELLIIMIIFCWVGGLNLSLFIMNATRNISQSNLWQATGRISCKLKSFSLSSKKFIRFWFLVGGAGRYLI